MKPFLFGLALTMVAQGLMGQSAPHVPLSVVSDWSQRRVLYPDSKDQSVVARFRKDPRWLHSWYLRHPEVWWPDSHRGTFGRNWHSRRDWSVSLGTATFEPLFDYNFDVPPETGYGTLNTADLDDGVFQAMAGTLTVNSGDDQGTFPLYPGGPGVTLSPLGGFLYDNVIYPVIDPPLDVDGLLFSVTGFEINLWGNSPGNYSFYDYNGSSYGVQLTETGAVNFETDPGGGQTFPAKFDFDVTAAPSCANDYVVIGIPANPASGGQANIVGVNNLYSSEGPSTPAPLCGTTGPAVMFAYASGTGEVPNALTISQNGSQLAYVENLTTGSSYFHVLTIGTTGTNGTSAMAAVIPGSAGGNNAVDQRVLLSPDGGVTNQSSTNAVFVVYTPNDANDVAYAATYSTAGNGSGYLYKLSNVFDGSATPAIVWSVPINAIPSSPIYDSTSNKVFFTDSNGRIDYVLDAGASPSVVYSPVLANGNTSENGITLDTTNEMVYATFNSNGTDAIVVQAPTSLSSTVSVSVGSLSTIYTGPYGVEFNNAWYTGSGTPLMYVAGTGTGSLPTLYSFGFDSSGVLDAGDSGTAALAAGWADSSPLTEFYNADLGKDYLFVGVTDNCIASIGGGTAGCVMSLDITDGFPTVNASTTALAAAGGTSGIIVDNDSTLAAASNIYYTTKSDATLVKATQSGLN